jgi:hypothetical protein
MPAQEDATKMPAKKAARKAQPPKNAAVSKRTAAAKAMSEDHKQALAAGRSEGRAVRAYLEALDRNKPKRGRRRTAESITKRLEQIELDIPYVDPLTRVHLVQEQFDLQSELEGQGEGEDLSALEDAFVEVVKGYSDRRGLTYPAWREVGIDPGVLRRAGIARTRQS